MGVNLEDKMLSEMGQSQKDSNVRRHFYEDRGSSNSWRQRVGGWGPGAGGGDGELVFTGTECQFGEIESSGDGRRRWLCDSVHALSALDCTAGKSLQW